MSTVVIEPHSQVVADRHAKLAELKRRGIEPYAYRYEVTHSSAAARGLYAAGETDGNAETEVVSVAGRVMSLRPHGKATFIDLSDREGQIQRFIRQNVVGAEAYEMLPLLDPGDWVGARGPVIKTRTGEVSVAVT